MLRPQVPQEHKRQRRKEVRDQTWQERRSWAKDLGPQSVGFVGLRALGGPGDEP